jgi:ABC-2 type transport system ATP-binding protein
VSDAPVVTTGLTKRFRQQTVVDRIDLEVPEGAVYGFLGPNGSGKTTTIRMLLGPDLGHRRPDPAAGAGDARGRGTALRRVGALVEGPAFHPYLSGRANLARLDAADRASDPRTSRTRIDAALDRRRLAGRGARSATGRTRSACGSGWPSPTPC